METAENSVKEAMKAHIIDMDSHYGVQSPPIFDVVNSASYFLISCYFLLFNIQVYTFRYISIELCSTYNSTLYFLWFNIVDFTIQHRTFHNWTLYFQEFNIVLCVIHLCSFCNPTLLFSLFNIELCVIQLSIFDNSTFFVSQYPTAIQLSVGSEMQNHPQ